MWRLTHVFVVLIDPKGWLISLLLQYNTGNCLTNFCLSANESLSSSDSFVIDHNKIYSNYGMFVHIKYYQQITS